FAGGLSTRQATHEARVKQQTLCTAACVRHRTLGTAEELAMHRLLFRARKMAGSPATSAPPRGGALGGRPGGRGGPAANKARTPRQRRTRSARDAGRV